MWRFLICLLAHVWLAGCHMEPLRYKVRRHILHCTTRHTKDLIEHQPSMITLIPSDLSYRCYKLQLPLLSLWVHTVVCNGSLFTQKFVYQVFIPSSVVIMMHLTQTCLITVLLAYLWARWVGAVHSVAESAALPSFWWKDPATDARLTLQCRSRVMQHVMQCRCPDTNKIIMYA